MIATISVTDDLQTCLALRRVVFIEEQGISEADELDDTDEGCVHMLATLNGMPIGCARLKPLGQVAKIGRVCVLPKQRGAGLGAALIRAAVDVARQQKGVTRVELGAQVQALGFYERLGFAAVGPVYDDAGIDHRDMVLML